VLRVLEYAEDREGAFREIAPAALAAAMRVGSSAPLVWIDVVDPAEGEVTALAGALGWHPLITEDVLHRADQALYEAKRTGRDRTVYAYLGGAST